MKSYFPLLLLSFFVFVLCPLAAESQEEKQTTPLEKFQKVLGLAPAMSASAFLKEHRQEMFETAEKTLDDPDLDPSMRIRIFNSVFILIEKLYGRAEPEMQETLTKEGEAFFGKYRDNKSDRKVCDGIWEAIRILPIKTKLEQAPENLPLDEQKELLFELQKTLEPLKIESGGFAHQHVVRLALEGIELLDKRIKDRTQREDAIPVLETFSKLLASKDSAFLKFLAWRFEQMLRRIQSDGKTSPWNDVSFTALDGQKMKIGDFHGKPLVVAFQPTEGPWLELLRDCVEHWKSKDLQVLLITLRFPDAEMKKFVEVCDISFPVWNAEVSGVPQELSEALPVHWANTFPNAMLIDAEGKVVNSYIGYENLAAEIGQLFGVSADDESLTESLKEVQEKSWGFFFKELRRRKLLDIPEDATAEQMHRRFRAALTNLLSPRQNMFDEQMIGAAAELPELADRIVAQTDDRKMIESMYDGLLFLAKNQYLVPARIPRFAENLAEKAKQHDFPKIFAEARLIDFKYKSQKVTNLGAFREFRKEVFDFVRESKDDCLPLSVVLLFRVIERGISRRYSNDVEAETYLEMANILEEMNDPATTQIAMETFRGIANRLQLLGREIPIEGETIDGKAFDPELYKGKVVLVDFWATWCGPCIAEVPNMKTAYEKYHEKGFDIVAISTDRDLDALKEYLEAKPLPWICLADELAVQSGKPAMKQRYGVQSIPTMILVDRDGRVVLLEARGQTLTDKLEELFAE